MHINDEDFVQKFDITKGVVGIVGHGYVGQAVDNFFKKKCKVVIYDKAKQLQSFKEVVSSSHVIFVCVPTPMTSDGKCHTDIVESVVKGISDESKKIGRSTGDFIVVIKSTVWPGFTEELQLKFHDMRIVFSPEFLTEKNSIQDFENQNRIIIGGDQQDSLVVFKFFEGVIPDKVKHDKVLFLNCPSTTAEMVKLYTNGILMTKILFSNEIYLMCQKLGVEYEEVRQLSCLDRRIGSSHTIVPGHDGQLGAGGHCFPKDMHNLKYMSKVLGTNEIMFSAVLHRNAEVREEKDWEKMDGRAIIKTS